MVGDIFFSDLGWTGGGGGGGRGGGGGAIAEKTPAQRKYAKKYNAKRLTQKKQGANKWQKLCCSEKLPNPRSKKYTFLEKSDGVGGNFFFPAHWLCMIFFSRETLSTNFFFGGQTLFLDFSIIFNSIHVDDMQ